MGFIKIEKRYGSELHYTEFFVDEDKNEIGVGSRLVDIKYPHGEILEEQNLSIVVKDNKQILLINGDIISEEKLNTLKFNFSNKDF